MNLKKMLAIFFTFICFLFLYHPIPTMAFTLDRDEIILSQRMLNNDTKELFTKKNDQYFRKTVKLIDGTWSVFKSDKINLPKTGLKRKTKTDMKDPQLAQELRTKLQSSGYVIGALPSVVDYAASVDLPPIGEQKVNDCVGWATGYYLRSYQEAKDLKWAILKNGQPDNSHIFSPSFIYNQINGGVDNGAFLDDAGNLLKDVGANTLTNFPYIPGDFLTQPNGSQKEAAYPHRIREWKVLFAENDSHDDMIQQTKQYLLTGDLPIIGVKIGYNFIDPLEYNGKSFVTLDNYNPWGHALAVVGYDDTINTPDGKGAFKIINSWGTGWGDQGFAYITYPQFVNSILECYVFTDLVSVVPTVTPALTSAAYDVGTGNLVLTGTNFVNVDGRYNDIDVTKLTISSGEYKTKLTSVTSNVEIKSPSSAIIRVTGTDKTAIKQWATRNGTGISLTIPYNIEAEAGWNGPNAEADLTNNPVTVSGNPGPTLQSAAYNVETGTLLLTATNLIDLTGEANDIDVTKFTISVGRNKVTLTSGSVDISSPTSIIISVNEPDKNALKEIAPQNGNSVLRVPYNIAAAASWNGISSKADLRGNPITVSGNPPPGLTSASYDVRSGTLNLSGTNLVCVDGRYNDIDVTKLTISSGEHKTTLTSATKSVEITSPTSAKIKVLGIDKEAITSWANRNGAGLSLEAPYNIAAEAGWNGIGALEDMTDNPVAVTGNSKPSVSVVTATINTGSDVRTAKSSKLATLYLIPDSFQITSKEEADAAVQNGLAQSCNVIRPNTNTIISTIGLTSGKYRVIAVDQNGNISDKSSGIITIKAF